MKRSLVLIFVIVLLPFNNQAGWLTDELSEAEMLAVMEVVSANIHQALGGETFGICGGFTDEEILAVMEVVSANIHHALNDNSGAEK